MNINELSAKTLAAFATAQIAIEAKHNEESHPGNTIAALQAGANCWNIFARAFIAGHYHEHLDGGRLEAFRLAWNADAPAADILELAREQRADWLEYMAEETGLDREDLDD